MPGVSRWERPAGTGVHAAAPGPATWVPLRERLSTSITSQPSTRTSAWTREMAPLRSSMTIERSEPLRTRSSTSGIRPTRYSASTV